MFFYYGGKRQMARRYTAPCYPLVVEPFAGAAGYSMRHIHEVERVLLLEKDERVVELWRRLLASSPAELRDLPVPPPGADTDDFLYMTAAASNAIANCWRMKVTERMPRAIRAMLRSVARQLPLVQPKVEIVHGDYTDAPDEEATWFIDPPYQVNGSTSAKTWFPQGMGYARGCTSETIDYAALADWCRSRRGQVIVCEQEGATWLPFRPLRGGLREAVWTNEDFGQLALDV